MATATRDDNSHLPPLVSLDASSISLALFVLGCYVCVLGQVSYFLKERLYLSSALLSVLVGIAVGPIGLNWISPWVWSGYDEELQSEFDFEGDPSMRGGGQGRELTAYPLLPCRRDHLSVHSNRDWDPGHVRWDLSPSSLPTTRSEFVRIPSPLSSS